MPIGNPPVKSEVKYLDFCNCYFVLMQKRKLNWISMLLYCIGNFSQRMILKFYAKRGYKRTDELKITRNILLDFF